MTQKAGEIVYCEAEGCSRWAPFNSATYRKRFRLVQVDKTGKKLQACSDRCADLIREGKYRKPFNASDPHTEIDQ